jgi:putative hemolysin
MPNAPLDHTFALDPAFHSRLVRAAIAAARPFLSAALGLRALHDLYPTSGTAPFESRALTALNIRSRIHGTMPTTGPLIVAANHPTGARDGLVLLEAVRNTRPDVRILANRLLEGIPELAGSCFFVDPFGGPAAAARSRAGLRAAHRWLHRGGALIIFPAGEVASEPGDAAWHPTIARLALATEAGVVPVFLDGCNSRAFYAAGRLHPRLRTLLLGRELLRQRGTTAAVRIGSAIDPQSLAGLTPTTATATIRRAVDALRLAPERGVEIVPPVDPVLLAGDIERLPARAMLLTSGAYDVLCAGADEIPHVLREIGRLREVTFRAVGEGTGRSIDLDRFDAHYLFVWNRVRREVVGAYRLGATDLIVSVHGVEGLYTRSLFRYDERILSRIGPALELGRSFVRAEYQRSSNALLLLWKGIGRFVTASPRYRVLFGPVSISSRYQDTSQHLLRAFLSVQHGDPALAALVEPTTPPPPMRPPARHTAAITDVGDLDALIRKLERTQGIPVLLRQYMRLNATLLGFNVDPTFGDALDALMMVDLERLPVQMRQRYLGVPSLRVAA